MRLNDNSSNFQSVSDDSMTTVTDMIQNMPWFEVTAQGLVIANQNQSGPLSVIICFETVCSHDACR